MVISFNEIPSNLRVPFVFVEFDTTRAQQGPSIQPYETLVFGQKLAAGSEPELTLKTITSEAQARTLYGEGSMLHAMILKYLANDRVTSLKAMSIDDAGGSVAATGSLLFSGTATADGTVQLYIAGRRVSVAISDGDTAAEVATAVVAQMALEPLLLLSSVVNGGTPEKVDLTAKNKGLNGDEIDVRFNYFEDNEFPAGISSAVTQMSGGTTNPDVAEIIAALPEDQFNIIVNPYTDAANLTVLETELADRFGPIRQNDGVALAVKFGSLGALESLGNSRNSPHSSITGPSTSAPNTPWEWAAAISGQTSKSAQADPGRPFQTLPLSGILAPEDSEQFDLTERNLLLFDGIATAKVSAGDVVRIERLITTFQTNPAGAPDTSLLDVNSLLILSFLRFDFRTTFLRKFPRHKLRDDGGPRPGPGQPIITPSVGKAEAIALFAQWEELALVEGLDQFKRDLVVERNISDPNRLDFLLPPDLINQLIVTSAQIQFLL